MSLNVDFNKMKTSQQEIQTNTPVEVKSTSASVNVPIGKTETANTDLCSKLGITQEQYVKLCSENAQFATLSFEEQLKFIKNIKQAAQTSSLTETTAENTVDTENDNRSQIQNDKEKPITTLAFSRMSIMKKFEVYSTELAKNEFLYGDKENKKTIEDWNSLSKEEQQKLIDQQKATLAAKKGALSRKNGHAWLDKSMTLLLAASENAQMSLADFKKQPAEYQEMTLYDYLYNQDIKDLSKANRRILSENNLLCEAVQYATGSDVKPCPAEARKILKEKNINYVQAEYEYLQNKTENGEKLSRAEKNRFESLSKWVESGVDFSKIGTKAGSTPKIFDEIMSSTYAESFEKASVDDKVIILKDYLEKTYDKNDPKYTQIVEDLMTDAMECGSLELADLIHSLAKTDKKFRKQLTDSDKESTRQINAVNNHNLDSEVVDYIKKEVGRGDKLSEQNIRAVQNTVEEKFMTGVAKATKESKLQSVHNGNVYMSQRAATSEIQKELVNIIVENGNQEAIELAAATADKYNDDVEKDALDTLTYENEAATHAAIDSNVYSRMAVENQKAAYEMMLKRNEEYTQDAKVAEQYSMQMADQVETLDASVQAEAHRIVSQSKFESVIEHAAENIYKYDESAQKDAMKYTLETGNEKAIEAAISNADRCEGLKNETAAAPSNSESYDRDLAREIRTYTTQIEQKYTQQVAQDYAEYSAEQDFRTGLIEPEETKSAIEEYIAKFKDPTSNKFALIGQLEPSQKKEAIKALVKYAPTLINSFIDMGYGPEIIKIIGETSDLAIKVVQLMDYKGQSEVREIVRKHPDHYEELYVKYFADDKQNSVQNNITSPFGGNSLLRQMNREGQVFFNI